MNPSWPKVPLGKVLEPAERPEVPIPGRRYRQVGVRLWGEGAYEREPIDGADTKYVQLWRTEAGDVIVNKIWARNGSVAVITDDLAGTFGSGEFPMFAPKRELLEPRWIHWLTRTQAFWGQCDAKSQGTSGKNRIRPERFLEIEVSLPPLAEQRRVVARIEELAAQIHEARSLRREAATEAAAVFSASLSRLCKSPLWRIATVGELVSSLRNGKSVKASGDGDGVRCLTLSSMRQGRVDISDNKPVPLTKREAEPFLTRKGDVFVVRGNGSKSLCGLAGMVGEDRDHVIFPDLFIRVELPQDRLLSEFFVAVWNSPATRTEIEERARTTSGIWKINQSHIQAISIPVPPLAEQRRIVGELQVLQVELDASRRLQVETAAELEAALPAILDRAFKGEL